MPTPGPRARRSIETSAGPSGAWVTIPEPRTRTATPSGAPGAGVPSVQLTLGGRWLPAGRITPMRTLVGTSPALRIAIAEPGSWTIWSPGPFRIRFPPGRPLRSRFARGRRPPRRHERRRGLASTRTVRVPPSTRRNSKPGGWIGMPAPDASVRNMIQSSANTSCAAMPGTATVVPPRGTEEHGSTASTRLSQRHLLYHRRHAPSPRPRRRPRAGR